jgi:hypothetical protein
MEGLKEKYKDEKEIYKKNSGGVFIFYLYKSTKILIYKLLIDPYNEYKLNYNEGNTPELNIQDKWIMEGFYVIIVISPYQPIMNYELSSMNYEL